MKSPLPSLMIALSCLPAIAICLLAFGSDPVASHFQVEETKPVKNVRLMVLDPRGRGDPTSSGPIRMGFLVELEPEWHIYWANPGDAGLAPSVRWTLPAGFKAGPLMHPMPRKSVQEDLVSFEHDSPVLLSCDIALPPAARPSDRWEAAAVLEWMACRESCIVGETPVRTGYPPDTAALEKGRSLLATFAPRFPRPLSEAGLSADSAQATFTGGEWLVEIILSGPRAAGANDFFPYPIEGFVIAHSRISCRDGKVALPLTPSRGPGAPPPQAIRGLVIIDGAGYEVNVSVASRPLLEPNAAHSISPWR